MSKFSMYLKDRINRSGESVASVARSIHVERTSLHKAMSGERTLPYGAVKALASHFNMPIDERQEFFRLYDLHLQGEEAYENRQEVCELLNTLASIDFTMPSPPDVVSMPAGERLIRGEYAIISTIRSVLIYESSHHENAQIQMFIPEKLNLTMELMELWLAGRAFEVTELLSLGASGTFRKNTDAKQNLQKLGAVIPLCLASRGKYKPYYFTERVGAFIPAPMPYYIVTPEFLIEIAGDLTVAQVRSDPELTAYYQNWFKMQLPNFDLLTQCSSDIMEVLKEYISGTSPESLQVIMEQPCPGRYITKEMIGRYLRNGEQPYEAMFQLVENHFSVLRKIQKGYVTVFTEKGLAELTEKRVLQDLPPQYVPPLDPDDIRGMLEALYDEIEKGTVTGLIARPAQLQIPDYLSFYAGAENELHIYTTNKFVFGAYSCDIHIMASSLCGMFEDFIKGLPGSPMVYSREETLELLRQYIDRVR